MKKWKISALDIIWVIILVIIASIFFPKNSNKEDKQTLQGTKQQETSYDQTQNLNTYQTQQENRVYMWYGTDYIFTSKKNYAWSECRNYKWLKSNVTMRTCDNGLIMIYVNWVQEKLQVLYFKESDIRDGIIKYPPIKWINYTTYPTWYTETYSNTKYSDYDDYYDDNRSYYEWEEWRDRHLDEYDEDSWEEY